MDGPENDESGPVGLPIVICDRPVCIWSTDHAATQLEFIDAIDPGYFSYVASVHSTQLENDEHLQAAVALRLAYAHALESLFAILGAALQAPMCPATWLLCYKNAELARLVERIDTPWYRRRQEDRILNRLGIADVTWSSISDRLLPWPLAESAQIEVAAASSALWESLAREFLDPTFQQEYNSLKHGFRVRAGGWFLAIGLEDTPGVPAAPERMRMVSQSDYGSSFLRTIPLKTHQWALETQRVNWTPSALAKRLPLIGDSIANVVTFLKWANGKPPDPIRVAAMTHERVRDAIDEPSRQSINRFAFRVPIVADSLPNLTPRDILAAYGRDELAGGDNRHHSVG